MISKLEKILLMKPYIILMLLVTLVSANSLKNTFLSIDDDYLIVNNPKIDLPLAEIPSIFVKPLGKIYDSTADTTKLIYYRPVLELFYIFNYKIWGPNPVGFHLSNIILHLFNAVFLYKSGLILFNNNSNRVLISLIGASLFAVHPANNEVIARVALNENIYGFFIILSFYLFLKEKKYISSFVFLLALLSKEGAIMFPFVLMALSIYKRGFRGGVIEIAPYATFAVIYLVIRTMIVDSVFISMFPAPISAQILTIVVAVSDYIKLVMFPYPLSPFYPARLYTSVLEPKVIAAISTLILLSVLAFRLKKDKIMLSLLLFPFIMLAPVIFKTNTFPLSPELVYIAERFLYVPLMGFSLFVSALSMKIAGEKAKTYVVASFTAILIIFSVITISANGTWEDNNSVYSKITKEAPDSSHAHIYRAKILYNNGKLDKAIKELNNALTPSFVKLIANSDKKTIQDKDKTHKQNAIYNKHGEPINTESLNAYLPCFAEIHLELGRVYLAQGDIDKATRKFKVATILSPDFVEAHYNLGDIYQRQGKFDDAIKEYESVLKLDPKHADARHNIGILNIKKKQLH